MNLKIALVALLFYPAISLADQVIELADGSRLYGEVLSMKNNQYQIKTSALGIVTLDAAKIASISSNDAARSSSVVPKNSAVNPAMQSIQSTITSDPGLMSKILSLQNDPQMQAVLSDPEIMREVQTLDFDALSNNPKIKALMENPTVKSIQSRTN